jgi:putative endonuclease
MKQNKTINLEKALKNLEKKIKNVFKSKNSKKIFGYIFVILFIISSAVFYNMFKSSEEAEATWWDDTWSYRRAITVTNNTTEESEVYINLSIDSNNYYIGQTNNIERRLKEHNNGKNKSTKNRRPLKLIGYEMFNNQNEARYREYELKNKPYKKKKFINELINQDEK